jgi:hypothetical protein
MMFMSAAACDMVVGNASPGMRMEDTMPALVRSFVKGGHEAAQLLSEFMRHVARVARPYPDAYFVLSQKNNEAVDDLGNRAFSICASIEKGRFPFSGRPPFTAYVEEQFDGRTIRYHSFYAKLAITRELLRDDYAFNLRRNPVLRWRAELYADIGTILKESCESVPQGRGVPPKWQRAGSGLRMLQPPEVVQERLRQLDSPSLETLVHEAIAQAGPQTQSRLTNMLEAVLGTPSVDEPEAGVVEDHTADRLGLREAVAQAWGNLEPADQGLVIALSKGASYEELISGHPSLNNKVSVSRAVSRVGQYFLSAIVEAMGVDAAPDATPRTLMEPIMAMLSELFPRDFA